MAPSNAKQLSLSLFFFFLIIISSSLQIHARDSHFFSKVSSKDETTPQLAPNTTLNKDETHQVLTPTTNPSSTTLNNNQQQDPNFIPEADNSGGPYGLYSHESGQLPPSTTTTTNEENQELYSTQGLPSYYNKVAYMTPIHSTNKQYNGDNTMYNPQKQDFARFSETGYTTTPTQSNNNMYNMYNGYNNNDNNMMYNSQKQGMRGYNSMPTNGGGNMYNTQKQGMSDTRFLENGKYFYDINSENNYNSNANGNTNAGGYYGNYNNNRMNAYNYENNADGGGYQNQEQYYQENQEDQYIP